MSKRVKSRHWPVIWESLATSGSHIIGELASCRLRVDEIRKWEWASRSSLAPLMAYLRPGRVQVGRQQSLSGPVCYSEREKIYMFKSPNRNKHGKQEAAV